MANITPHQSISLKIAELDAALKSQHPSMPTLLRDIHANLKQDTDVVTLLSPEDIAIIVRGLSRQTDTVISDSILSGKKGKSASKLSIDDI